ncbi:MAG TPA: MASE1 domain-containing protein, partial [Thermoanaerobaculia bacterium]|nr:MASE1 domain-containing protein [Thermoanaerobaculia bacterium]
MPSNILAPAAVAIAYFLGSLLGLSLPFPSTQVSVFWPPNAILLAALLVTPRGRWWPCLLAVLPAHVAVQALMGISLDAVLINFVGNAGEALVGALIVDHFLSRQERFDRLQAVALIMFFGGIVAPALMSFVVAQLFAQTGSTVDPWVNGQLRLLTNALAVFTLVPPIVLNFRNARPPATPLAARRAGEAGALLIGLAISGALLFALPKAGTGHSQLLLYAPFPFLLWAAMRFGVVGLCLSVLTLAAVSTWNAVHGHGPFETQDPVHNATALVLFLNVTCVPLLMLAALLEERESQDLERRSAATLHSAVLASMHDQIAVLDRDGVVREVNESWTAADRPDPGVDYLGGLRSRVEKAPDESAVRKLAGLEAVLRGDRERFQMELRRSPSSNGWVEMSAEGLRRPEGGAVITYTDISARKRVEDEMRLQRQELAHLTRVAMLGELSGALAHELNQPLTAILSNAQAGQRLMAKRPVDLAEVREILDDIAADDRRAGEVIQRLRAMLKKGETKMVALAVNDLALEVLRFAHGDLITRNVRVVTELAPDLPQVVGDRVQLQQVLLNLVLNGCEAMSGNPSDERQLNIVTARDGESAVRVAVGDSGSGIAADEIERLFEPFFTTKEHGLGLGLAICRSIVEAHSGRLWASNNEE